MKITGTYNNAIVYNDNIDEESRRQIQEVCNSEIFSGSKIRIMPDVHAGKGCVIGYTAELGEKIIPNLIGLDIGCGIMAANLGRLDLKFDKIDRFIRQNIPYGFKRNKSADPNNFPGAFNKKLENTCAILDIDFEDHMKGIGSLGGGNHFIEIAVDENRDKWLLIHSGSRNFGLQVATFHQKNAQRLCREKDPEIPSYFAYLEGKPGDDYIRDMKVAQEYASLNRHEMKNRILSFLGLEKVVEFETVHNYINFKDSIVRKGAVSAQHGEQLIIPMNMKDGSLIARGKGNPDWNFSAPHGAGRRLSRTQARKQLDLDEFRKSMKSVWTSSISKKTLDEAPGAYKNRKEILRHIKDSVEIESSLKPLYNFKAE